MVSQPEGFDIPRDSGFVPVAQLGYLWGRAIPAAAGPIEPLRDFRDDARDRPCREQSGIDLVLETLAASQAPVVISVVGSARVLTAAFNRAHERGTYWKVSAMARQWPKRSMPSSVPLRYNPRPCFAV